MRILLRVVLPVPGYLAHGRIRTPYSLSSYGTPLGTLIGEIAPPPPASLQATAVSSSQIDLTWAYGSDKAAAFKLERKSGTNGAYAEIALLSPNRRSYSDTGLAASTTYFYRIRAFNSGGDSSYSNEASAATMALPTFTLAVTKIGTGSGTVTSNPTGIDCGTDCSEPYNSGTSVALTATPVTGSVFDSWNGDCSGTGSCAVGMTANRSVTASFVQCTYALSSSSQSFSSASGVGSVGVTALSGCGWSASSNASWITVTGGSSGSGNGTVNYSVAANPGTTLRSGTLTIAGQTFTVTQVGLPTDVTLFSAPFNTNSDSFTYADDTFRGTAKPAYASGNYDPAGGFAGGGLHVVVGGVDGSKVIGMSGGWQRDFAVSQSGTVRVSLKYRLEMDKSYDPGECGQALVALDGTLLGVGPDSSLQQFCGTNPNVLVNQDSGWQTVMFNVAGVGAGLHRLTVGGWNGLKNSTPEKTDIFFDDITVTQAGAVPETQCTDGVDNDSDGKVDCADSDCASASNCVPETQCTDGIDNDGDGKVDCADSDCSGAPTCVPETQCTDGVDNDGDGQVDCADTDCSGAAGCGSPPPLISAAFNTGSEGFTYVDDTFRGTAKPAYASGNYDPAGGFAGGGLHVVVGGVDGSKVIGMSGGWQRDFTVSQSGTVRVSLRYRLVMDKSYDPGECGQALVTVDGQLVGPGPGDFLQQFCGTNPNALVNWDSGWQTVVFDVVGVGAGLHRLTVGGWNGLKNSTSEKTDIFFDDITVTQAGLAGSSITVVTPNGGENWSVGSTQTIQWNSSGVSGNVKVELSRDGGATWASLFSNTANDGGESWTVTGPVTTQAKIRVSSVNDLSVIGTSNANFQINDTSITVTIPNGGETWTVGSARTIQWNSTGISGNVKIELSRDGGATWATLLSSTANDGSESWKVTKPVTTQARIRVSSINSPSITDISNANFTIQK